MVVPRCWEDQEKARTARSRVRVRAATFQFSPQLSPLSASKELASPVWLTRNALPRGYNVAKIEMVTKAECTVLFSPFLTAELHRHASLPTSSVPFFMWVNLFTKIESSGPTELQHALVGRCRPVRPLAPRKGCEECALRGANIRSVADVKT